MVDFDRFNRIDRFIALQMVGAVEWCKWREDCSDAVFCVPMAEKIIKTGNSSAVTLPAKFMKNLGLRIGDPVEAEIDYVKGEIVFRFPGARQLHLVSRSDPKKSDA